MMSLSEGSEGYKEDQPIQSPGFTSGVRRSVDGPWTVPPLKSRRNVLVTKVIRVVRHEFCSGGSLRSVVPNSRSLFVR